MFSNERAMVQEMMVSVSHSEYWTQNWIIPLTVIIVIGSWLSAPCQPTTLKDFAGPVWARYTDLWRYLDVRKGLHHLTLLKLHLHYGNVVLIGPRTVSVADPFEVPSIYGINSPFLKGKFYDAFTQHSRGKEIPSLFTEKNPDRHRQIKRPVAHAYSMSALLGYESLVDRIVGKMLQRMQEEFTQATFRPLCDLGKWLQYYSFDVITAITFSTSLGFLENGHDMDGLIDKLDQAMDSDAPVSQLPWIKYIKKGNPLRYILAQDSGFIPSFVKGHITARKVNTSKRDPNLPQLKQDFLDQFLEAQSKYPDTVDEVLVWSYCITNIAAGSDSVAVPLRSIFYFLLCNPEVYDRLIRELKENQISFPVAFKTAICLPYLNAVIREALRIHPPVGLGLERVVPPSGHRLRDGTFIPAGYKLSICPWVVNRDRGIFGADADNFNPERWLKQEEEDEISFFNRTARMKRFDFTFGYGPRACIGKNISLLEIYKLVPSLLILFDFKLMTKELKIRNSWFVRQEGLLVELSMKHQPS